MNKPNRKGTINCDQVYWLVNIFDRYLPKDNAVRASMQREMKLYGMLYEVMEIADLSFEDSRAFNNALPAAIRSEWSERFSNKGVL